jgi:hypothetical protein
MSPLARFSQAKPARWRSIASASSRLSVRSSSRLASVSVPGGDDARHGAIDRSLGLRWIGYLLANGHGHAELDQFGEIAVRRVVWNAGHGDGLARRLGRARSV